LGVALLLFWAGPYVAEWIKGSPRLESDGWVFYLVVVCGVGFGATAGAVVGGVATLVEALRARRG
jgi:hypothetical protein